MKNKTYTYDSVKEKVIKIIDNNLYNNKFAEAQASHKKPKKHVEVKTSDELNVLLESLEKVECIMDIEKEFDIRISDEDAEKMLVVKDLVNFVCERNNIKIPKETKKIVPTKPVNPAVLAAIKKELVKKR